MIKITDAEVPLEAAKAQSVVIGDLLEKGEIIPRIYDSGKGEIVWHANLKPRSRRRFGGWLLQGHGPTPALAVLEAVIEERAEIEERRQMLAAIEAELGTAGMTPEQMRRKEGGVA